MSFQGKSSIRLSTNLPFISHTSNSFSYDRYYIWIYWLNCFAWLLRALAVNEFQSGKYNGPSGQPGYTEGDLILVRLGFTLDGEPFDFGWVWWGILFALACSLGSMLLTSFCLNNVRFATGLSLGDAVYDDAERTPPSSVQGALLPFQRGNLTFKNMHYVVTSSITKESLELLKGIDGVIESGKMLALMGSSGAGKSTLLDVLALRKTSGTIEGDVRLNGHPIEPSAFRRCIGYVEQFDVQSAQLTIRETADFSAKLRLDENTVSKESREKFVEETLSILEMTNIQHLQVGTDDSGGLSFEQRKRLSILNELVSNPAIIFLDEPTSGLDSRAASIVMRGLKRIALSGRAVCATIHQPSIAIFNEFDTLLLLKRGGEVVYHGPIGDASCDLIRYLERYKDTPKIMPGENPATWMLKVIGAGREARTKPFDYTGSYAVSDLHFQCLEKIEEIYINATEENKVAFKEVHAASNRTQLLTVFQKGWLVYFRSPSYNTVRMTVSGIIALLFSSVYASSQIPTTESDMASRINSIFISVLFMLVNAQNTVLGVFENERNMFYRHKSANMYGASAVLVAYTLAEIPFILLTSIIFCVLFYFIMGFELAAEAFFIFFLFVTLGIATFTFCGQMLVSLVKDAKTAQSLGGLIVSFTSLFSGVLIPPQSIPEFWSFMYWIMPGHWIMEGLFTSQYGSSQLPIEASVDSPFYVSLGCNNTNDPCVGTAGEWLAVSFPDFSESHIKWDATFLVIVMIITRAVALTALSFLNYRST
jgi:ABC-type multidrug transport system ATPase subunit/ABC-type multidrug transport system permease subunit